MYIEALSFQSEFEEFEINKPVSLWNGRSVKEVSDLAPAISL